VSISVVIPWRDTGDRYRTRILEWITQRYREILPDAELILADNEKKSFCRGGSRNYGAKLASGDFLVFADADTVPCASFIERGIKMVKEGAPWVLPYGEMGYYNTDEKSALFVLDQIPGFALHPDDITYEHRITSWAGQVIMEKDDLHAMGGYDERFEGWGYEDNAFRLAADTLLGPHERVPFGYAIHLWHPAPIATTWHQPMITDNRQLYAEYEAAIGDKEKMVRLALDRFHNTGSV